MGGTMDVWHGIAISGKVGNWGGEVGMISPRGDQRVAFMPEETHHGISEGHL
jgi:hypothetical protein